MTAPREFLQIVFSRLPRWLRSSLRRTRWWLRWARWKLLAHRGYPNPSLFINEGELLPQFREALRYLQEKLGAENTGDFLEFGVCQGTSLGLMYDELLDAGLNHVRLFGFDSFAGLPHDVEGEWEEGRFLAHYEDVVDSLDQQGIDWKRVSLVKGFYEDTLTEELIAELGLHKVSLIMIDCDLYSSAKEALDFCRPLILDEAVVFFDDWNPLAKANKGEKRAFDEFLQEHPEFEAVAMGVYDYTPGDQCGKVFRVSRARA